MTERIRCSLHVHDNLVACISSAQAHDSSYTWCVCRAEVRHGNRCQAKAIAWRAGLQAQRTGAQLCTRVCQLYIQVTPGKAGTECAGFDTQLVSTRVAVAHMAASNCVCFWLPDCQHFDTKPEQEVRFWVQRLCRKCSPDMHQACTAACGN